MKDNKNLTILVLSITAVILLAIVVGTKMDNSAYAGGVAMKQNEWIMTAAAATSKSDMLYMINVGQRQMNVYAVNTNNKKIEKIDTVSLDEMFK